MAAEQRFDDGGACGRATDAVFLHSVAQFFIVNEFACRLHGAQERTFVIHLWGLRGLFQQRWLVRAALSHHKFGHVAVVVGVGAFGVVCRLVFAVDGAPAFFEYLLACGFKLKLTDFRHHGGGGELTIRIECGDKALSHKVVNQFLVACEHHLAWVHIGGYDGVVVGDFGVVEHLFALFDCTALKHRRSEMGIRCHGLHNARYLRVDVVAQKCGVNAWIGGHLLLVERLNGAQGHVSTV